MTTKQVVLLCAAVGMLCGMLAGAIARGQPQKGSTGVVPVEDALELSRQVMVYRAEADSWRKMVDERDAMWGKRCQELKDEARTAELNAWKKVKAELEGAGVMKR